MRYRKALTLLMLLALSACGGTQQAAQTTAGASAPAPGTMTSAPVALATVAATAAPSASAGPSPTPTLAPGTFKNPVIDKDFPDPDALKVGDSYYAYATNDEGSNIQAAKSTDLVHWDSLPDALPVLPAWAEHGNTWAPEVSPSADGKSYVMYFVARVAGTGRQCIGAAASPKPEGPFESTAEKPLICQVDQGGSIDPSAFVDDDGTRYVLWKNDGNCCGGQTWIYIQKVAADGMMLEGEPTKLITADQVWEGPLVEAPTLWKHAGKYYLLYSANDYKTPNYAVGYAVADNPLGPYTKGTGPLLKSVIKEGVLGPGGQDIVAKGDRTWLLYHSWTAGSYRRMNIDELQWQGDKPVVEAHGRTPESAP